MGSKRFFLHWVLLLSFLGIGATILYVIEGYQFINSNDRTKISFLIMGIFSGMTFWYAFLSWKIDALAEKNAYDVQLHNETRWIELTIQHGYWAENTCTALGFLGTVIGLFLAMDQGVIGQLLSGAGDQTQALTMFVTSIRSASLTTILGIIGAVFLSLQSHILLHGISKLRLREG